MITLTVSGNVGKVEFKKVSESSLLDFSVASTSKFGDKELTTWLTCKIWGKRADGLKDYIKKGTALILSGSLRQENWEKDGEKRSKLILNVSDLEFQRGGKKEDTNTVTKPAYEGKDDAFNDDIPF